MSDDSDEDNAETGESQFDRCSNFPLFRPKKGGLFEKLNAMQHGGGAKQRRKRSRNRSGNDSALSPPIVSRAPSYCEEPSTSRLWSSPDGLIPAVDVNENTVDRTLKHIRKQNKKINQNDRTQSRKQKLQRNTSALSDVTLTRSSGRSDVTDVDTKPKLMFSSSFKCKSLLEAKPLFEKPKMDAEEEEDGSASTTDDEFTSSMRRLEVGGVPSLRPQRSTIPISGGGGARKSSDNESLSVPAQTKTRKRRSKKWRVDPREDFHKTFGILVRLGEKARSMPEPSTSSSFRSTSYTTSTSTDSQETILAGRGEVIWYHLKAFMQGRKEPTLEQDDYFYQKRIEAKETIGQIKTFKIQPLFPPMLAAYYSRGRNDNLSLISPGFNRSPSIEQLRSDSTRCPSVPTMPSSDRSERPKSWMVHEDNADVRFTVDAEMVLAHSKSIAEIESLVASDHDVVYDITRLTDVFIERHQNATDQVHVLLRNYEKIQSLYHNSRAMEKDQADVIDDLVRTRLKVLYIWFNVSRGLCRKLKEIGRSFLSQLKKRIDPSRWPMLDYHSPDEDDASCRKLRFESVDVMQHVYASQERAPSRSVSELEICPDANLCQAMVEHSLNQRKMTYVLCRVFSIIGGIVKRARQVLMRKEFLDPLLTQLMAAQVGPQAASVAERKGGKKPTPEHKLPLRHRGHFAASFMSYHHPKKVRKIVPVSPEIEFNRFLKQILNDQDTDTDLLQYGLHHPEFRQMKLPSFDPIFLTLIGVPVNLVLEWLKFRIAQKKSLTVCDPISLPGIIIDCRDVISHAVLVKRFYMDNINQVVADESHRSRLLDEEFHDFQEKLNELFKDVYLYYVGQWAAVEIAKELTEDGNRKMMVALEKEWRFAKKYAIDIDNCEAHAASQFCIIGQNMFEHMLNTLIAKKLRIGETPAAAALRRSRSDAACSSTTVDSTDTEMLDEDDPCPMHDDVEEEAEFSDDDTDELENDVDDEHEMEYQNQGGEITPPPCVLVNGWACDERNMHTDRRHVALMIPRARLQCENSVMVMSFLREDLEITSAYRRKEGVTIRDVLDKLQETNHKLIKPDIQLKFMIFVPPGIEENASYESLLLNVTCGRTKEESPEMELCRSNQKYLLFVSCASYDYRYLVATWAGKTSQVTPNVDTRISLLHIEVDDIQMVVVHTNYLVYQQRVLRKVLTDQMVKLVEKQCSCHQVIALSMATIRTKAIESLQKIVAWIRTCEEELYDVDSNDLSGKAYATHLSDAKNISYKSYDFAFYYYRELSKVVFQAQMRDLANEIYLFAKQWMTFVLKHCESGHGKRPSWSETGLQFLILATEPRFTKFLNNAEFDVLKGQINNCVTHLIGTPKSPTVDHGAGMSTPGRRESLLSSNQSSGLSRPSSLLLTQKSRSGSPDFLVRGRLAMAELEKRREAVLKNNKQCGSVTTKKPTELPTKRKVNFMYEIFPNVLMGEGASGKVFGGMARKGKFGDDRESLAIKVIPASSFSLKHGTLESLYDEIKTFEGIQHKHLVRYYGLEVHVESVYIFMEFCGYGTLTSVINNEPEKCLQTMRGNTLQILSGVAELHRLNIVHRDIKPDNIFVSKQYALKLGDFGLSVKLKNKFDDSIDELEEVYGHGGTIPYMAPEIVTRNMCSFPADIWSVGCVVLEMATGKKPWHDCEGSILYQVGVGVLPTIPRYVPSICQKFIRKCLTGGKAIERGMISEPHFRATAVQLLDEQYVKVGQDSSSSY